MNTAMIFGIVAVALAFLASYFGAFRYKYSPGQAAQRIAQEKTNNPSIIAAYICKQSFWFASELYITDTSIFCRQADKELWSVPVADVKGAYYSYWALQIIDKLGKKYTVGAITPSQGTMDVLTFKNRSATDKQTLENVISNLTRVGISSQKKLVLEKNLVLNISALVFAIGVFAVLLVVR